MTRGATPAGKVGVISCRSLSSEAVEGTALPLQGIDHVHGCDGLPLGVLAVGDCITDHVLQEHFEDSSGLFVDQTADTFHSTPSGKPTDGGFGDTLDVITKDLSVPFGASFSTPWTPLIA